MDGMHNSNSNSIWDRDIRNEDTESAPGLQPQEMPDQSAGTAVLEREETDEKTDVAMTATMTAMRIMCLKNAWSRHVSQAGRL